MARLRTEWRDNPDVVAEFQNLEASLRGASIATRFWNRVMSEKERQRLGGVLEEVWPELGLIGMYRKLYRVPRGEAVLAIGRRLDMLDESTFDWLAAKLGIRQPKKTPASRPQWRPEPGVLVWNGRVVRTVRRFRNSSHIFRILSAFQAKRWPRRLRNTFDLDPQKLHSAVVSLNRGLEDLRFRVSDGAGYVSWELV